MFEKLQPSGRLLRSRAELLVMLVLIAIALGLAGVVSMNVATSRNLRLETEKSHMMAEMQIALTSVESHLDMWMRDPESRRHPATDPQVLAAAAAFDIWAERLAAVAPENELAAVYWIRELFDDLTEAVATVDGELDSETLQNLITMGLAVRSPLLELLEEENDHMLESVAAVRRAETLIRWGSPALVVLAFVVLASMVRLRGRSRQLDEQRRANEKQTQFIAAVSHELRTPLTAIVAYSHELRDRLDDFLPSEIVEFVETISDESDEVSAIVEDLLAAARIETGQLTIVPESLDVAEQIVAALHTVSDTGAIEVQASGRIIADRHRVRQIIRNLISNAQRYGGPEIRVTSLDRGDHVLIVVSDSGSPIPDELREKIFEPFSTVGTSGGVATSVGLGLAVSRNLAELMGGHLTYTHDGSWSHLNLRLPSAPRRDAAMQAIEKRAAVRFDRREA